jgi:hypothetical protein
MRFQTFSTLAASLALMMLLSGCSWLPEYMKAKAAINAKYEKREENIELRYSRGQISDETYERLYEDLYKQWDNELTIAKAKAQGVQVASTQRSSRKRRTASTKPTPSATTTAETSGARFDTYTAEYVGSSSRGSGSGGSGSTSSEAKPQRQNP